MWARTLDLIFFFFYVKDASSLLNLRLVSFHRFRSWNQLNGLSASNALSCSILGADAGSSQQKTRSSNMPDRLLFKSFFTSAANVRTNKIGLNQFILYDDINILLDQGNLSFEIVKFCWEARHSLDEEINNDEAYDVLCCVISTMSRENKPKQTQTFDAKFLRDHFLILSEESLPRKTISMRKFFSWNIIRNYIDQSIIQEESIIKKWLEIAGSLHNPLEYKEFLTLFEYVCSSIKNIEFSSNSKYILPYDDNNNQNKNMNHIMLSYDISNEINQITDVHSKELLPYPTVSSSTLSDSPQNFELVDVWSDTYDPKISLEPAFISYLEHFFYKHTTDEIGLSYKTFAQWKDITELLMENNVDNSCLQILWTEALEERKYKLYMNDNNIDFDTFLRLNVRLDETLNELYEMLASSGDELMNYDEYEQEALLASFSDGDFESYHRHEFYRLTNDKTVLSYSQLLEWDDLKEMIEQEQITLPYLRTIWDNLPKKYLTDNNNINHDSSDNNNDYNIYNMKLKMIDLNSHNNNHDNNDKSTSNNIDNSQSTHNIKDQIEGINLQSFLELNIAILDLNPI